jgi:hypothetical protein
METKTRKLIAEIPEDVFKALKIRAVETDMLMRDLVTEALRQFLGLKGGGAATKTRK